jgi:hypothetical protein
MLAIQRVADVAGVAAMLAIYRGGEEPARGLAAMLAIHRGAEAARGLVAMLAIH